ncbi:MAG: hypothetical protein FJ254_05135 [Phycisphaerae bacterium]|nr:hypothetical protein [Phycisphaerae bacterium]
MLRAGPSATGFWGALAEAQVIAAALTAGASTELHVPTHEGRTCDLVATRGSSTLWVHVKSLAPEAARDDAPIERRRAVQEELVAALRGVESVARGVVVSVEALAPIVSSAPNVEAAQDFLHRASIGDALLVRSAAGDVLGRLCVLSPWDGGHVAIAPGDVQQPGQQRDRIDRLMRKACAQFMPGARNLVAIAAMPEQELAIDWALLGTPIERWDRFPRRGERVAFGRADDGFWSRGREPMCRLTAWMAPWPRAGRAWLRDAANDDASAFVRDLCAEQPLVQRDPGSSLS